MNYHKVRNRHATAIDRIVAVAPARAVHSVDPVRDDLMTEKVKVNPLVAAPPSAQPSTSP